MGSREVSLVEIVLEVSGQHDDPVVLLEALQELVDLDVRVPVVRVADLRSLAEQRVTSSKKRTA